MAAEKGLSQAQHGLGYMYKNGDGVVQDYKEAVKWYKKAAEQGDADGQFGLGTMYQNGHGVIQDIVSAHMWFNIASSNGHKIASAMIEMFLIKEMTASQIAEAQKMARDCEKKNYKNCE
jgi:TPR repeat protein